MIRIAIDAGANTGETPGANHAREMMPHLDAVYRFALRLCRGRQAEAEALIQNVFVRAYRSWSASTAAVNRRVWLFALCRRGFRQARDEGEPNPAATPETAEAEVETLAATAPFDEISAAEERRPFFDSFDRQEVFRTIDSLPEAYREAVVLSDLEGLSYSELAAVLEVPVATAKGLLFRGRRLLQQALYRVSLERGYLEPPMDPPSVS